MLLFVQLLVAVSAQAQPRVVVPPGCGSEAELESELTRLLGEQSARTALPDRLYIARAEAGGYALELELEDESRALRDADCRALFETAVVVAAAAVDPRVQARPVSPPDPAPESHEAPRAPPSQPQRAELHAEIALGAGATLALLPQLSPVFELSGALGYGRVGLALAARGILPAAQRDDGGVGAEIYGLGGRVLAYYDPLPLFRVAPGIALDRLTGQGRGSDVRDVSGSGLALAAVLEACATPLRAGHARLSLALSAHYALLRPSFEITGYGAVYRVPAVGGSGMLRLGWEVR